MKEDKKPKEAKTTKIQPKSLQTPKTTKTVVSKAKILKSQGFSNSKKLIKSKTTDIKPLKIRKKSKNKKLRIIIKTIAFSLIAIILIGIGSIFVLNDFAMTTLLSNNSNRSFYIVEEAMDYAFDAEFFEIEMYYEYRPVGAELPTSFTNAKMKVIKNYDNTYEYTSISNLGNYSANFYYKQGVLYTNIEEINFKQKQTISTIQSTFQTYMQIFLDGKYIIPTASGVLANKNEFQTLKTSFIVNSSPFYIGENFEINYTNEKEIYKLDVYGNLKERTYIQIYMEYQFTLRIAYTSINKMFQLQYPTDLNTYTT